LYQSGLEDPPTLRPPTIAACQALVGAGLGVAVVPGLALAPTDPATSVIQVPGLLPERLIVLVRHREREYTAAVLTLIELIERSFNPRGLNALL
jgi:DNA-binding transcriptional LysR family regulator